MKTEASPKKDQRAASIDTAESAQTEGASLMPPSFSFAESPVQRQTPTAAAITGEPAAPQTGSETIVIVHVKNANTRQETEGYPVGTDTIPQGTLAKEVGTAADSKGKAIVQIEYLSAPGTKKWTTSTNCKAVADKGNAVHHVAYSDTYYYEHPYGKRVKENNAEKKATDQLKVKLKYAVDGFAYATDEAGTFLGWIPEHSLISADSKKRYDYWATYKTWLQARTTEVAGLNGQTKLDRVQGLLAQVEYVHAQVRAGTYPEVAQLSTNPAFNDNHRGTFVAPEMIGAVRALIEITEREIANGDGTNLAHSANAKAGGSLFSAIDWNSRLGVPTYRTQSDNLAAPEASCAPTSFTMVMERLGYNRESIIAAIDEKLTGHRLTSYRKSLWAQQEYRREQFLLTPEGQAATKKGGTVTVPEAFQPATPMPNGYTPTAAMPATFQANVVIPNNFTPATVFDAAERDTQWETKFKAYFDKEFSSGLDNYQKLRGGTKGELSDNKDDLADSYRNVAQMEDLVEFLFYCYSPDAHRTTINSANSQYLRNRVAKPGYNTAEANIGSSEKLEGWKPEHRVKLRECLDAGGGAVMSVYHKGQGESGTHNISIQAVTSTGLVIDDPFGKINPDYRRKSGTSQDMYVNTGGGNSPSTRDVAGHDWKNRPHYDAATTSMEDSDFTATAAQNLEADEKRGDSTFISYDMLNESTSGVVNYIVLYKR